MPRRRLALAAVFCAVAMSVTSITSISVALPLIATDLDAAPDQVIPIVNLFQLTLVATLLPCAALGQRFGCRRLFLAGMLVMGGASLACALTRDLNALVLARIFQAMAGAAIMAMNPALIRLSVPAVELGRAIGINATVVAIFTALGPSIAALVLSIADWHWLFLINLPWVMLALAVGYRALPASNGSQEQPFDIVAALLNIALFVTLFTGLRTLATAPATGAAWLALGTVLLTGLTGHQRRQPAPLLPLDLLALPVVRHAVAASVCAFAAQLAAMVALPFLLHREFGFGMAATGLCIMLWPATVAVMALLSARLLKRFSSAVICASGSALLAGGLLLLSLTRPDAGSIALAVALIACGAGFGCFQTPNNQSMIAATPRARSGSAGGLQATARLCGQTLGTTLAAAVFLRLPDAAARTTLLAAAGFAACAALISLGRGRLSPPSH